MRDPLGITLNGRNTLLALLLVVGLFAALLAPNLLWLKHSTMRISNGSPWPLKQISVEVRGGQEEIETLAPGAKVVILLPARYDTDVKLSYRIATGSAEAPETRGCVAGYVQRASYHVVAEIGASGNADCRAGIASLKQPLLFEIF